MQTNSHWKTEIGDLRAQALAVRAADPKAGLSAYTAARCMSGVVSLIVRRWDTETMQRACAELVRCPASWETSFGVLPRCADGRTPEPIDLLAVVARGILPLAGTANMRAALAFWASEDDSWVLQRLAAGAAL